MKGRMLLVYKLNDRQMEICFGQKISVRYDADTSQYFIQDLMTMDKIALIPKENVIYFGASYLWREGTHYAE